MSEEDQVKWRGVRPTDPEGNPIPIHIETALGNENAPAYPVYVQDDGTHSNPRKYEKDNGFYSTPKTIGATVTQLYVATPTVATDRARTGDVTIYTLDIENRSGGQAWVWLECPAGTILTVAYPVANNNELSKDWPAGLEIGSNDIFVNGTQNCVVQISGTEV